MADIDLKTLTYLKQEIDDKISDERDITNLQLDLKLDESEVGGSEGILKLVGGKVPSSNIPFATSIESSEGTSLTVVMSPALVRQEIDTYKALYVQSADKGIANGVAPLNASAKIDTAYLPNAASAQLIEDDINNLSDRLDNVSRYEFNEVNDMVTNYTAYSLLNSIDITNTGTNSIWELKLSLTFKYSVTDRSAYFRYRLIIGGVVGDWIDLVHEPKGSTDEKALSFIKPVSIQSNELLSAEVQYRCEQAGDVLTVPHCTLIADRKV